MKKLKILACCLLAISFGILVFYGFDDTTAISAQTEANTCDGAECANVCGDTLWNVNTEECDPGCAASYGTVNDYRAASVVDECALCGAVGTTLACKCIPNTCGDGYLGSDEKCEEFVTGVSNWTQGDVSCMWDYDVDEELHCNTSSCTCETYVCGNGYLEEGETCEVGNPTGSTCTWDNCSQDTCQCVTSNTCGDGTLAGNETCEMGNPTGSSCTWDNCDTSSCTCKTVTTTPVTTTPKTAVHYTNALILGSVLLFLGLLFEPLTSLINRSYLVIGDKLFRVGRKKK